jgi:hypothetical protein
MQARALSGLSDPARALQDDYGFIQCEERPEKIYFHQSRFPRPEDARAGAECSFYIATGADGVCAHGQRGPWEAHGVYACVCAGKTFAARISLLPKGSVQLTHILPDPGAALPARTKRVVGIELSVACAVRGVVSGELRRRRDTREGLFKRGQDRKHTKEAPPGRITLPAADGQPEKARPGAAGCASQRLRWHTLPRAGHHLHAGGLPRAVQLPRGR